MCESVRESGFSAAWCACATHGQSENLSKRFSDALSVRVGACSGLRQGPVLVGMLARFTGASMILFYLV